MPLFEIIINQAIVDFKAGKSQQAMESLRTALKNNPSTFELWQALGVIAVRSNILTCGIEALSHAAALRPLDHTRYEELANAYILSEDTHRAIECLTSALALSPTNSSYEIALQKLQLQVSEKVKEKEFNNTKSSEIILNNDLFAHLQDLAEEKKYYELAKYASNHNADNSTDVRIRYILALTHEGLSQFESVIHHLEFVTSAMPAFAKASESLGDYLVMNSRVQRVISENNALVWEQFLNYENKLNQADAAYRKALDYAPHSLTCRLHFGNLCYYLGDLDEAEKQFLIVLENKPQANITRYNLAQIYKRKSRNTKARKELSQCLGSDPSFREATEVLAYVEMEMGNHEVAAFTFLKALYLEPSITPDLCE